MDSMLQGLMASLMQQQNQQAENQKELDKNSADDEENAQLEEEQKALTEQIEQLKAYIEELKKKMEEVSSTTPDDDDETVSPTVPTPTSGTMVTPTVPVTSSDTTAAPLTPEEAQAKLRAEMEKRLGDFMRFDLLDVTPTKPVSPTTVKTPAHHPSEDRGGVTGTVRDTPSLGGVE